MTTRPAMEIRYQPDALYHAYKTVRLEDKLGEDMTDPKRRIEDKLPGHSLDWSDAQAEQPTDALPPLPERIEIHALAGLRKVTARGYSGDQMRDYARAAIASHLARQSQATKVQAVPTFAQRLYGPTPSVPERRDALYTMALIFAASETDSAREANFEEMWREFLSVPRMSILDSLTRHTGLEISTNYTFETEEFFEVEAVERVLAAPVAKEVQALRELVNRFLAWPLPASLAATMPGIEQPIGTHLMNADEAKAMFEYVLATTAQEVTQQAAPEAHADTLRKSVRAIVQLVRDGEWADLLDMDEDAIALWDAVDTLLRRSAPTTQQAAKAETAEQAYDLGEDRIDNALANFLAEHTNLNEDGIDTHAMMIALAINYAALKPVDESDVAEWYEQGYLAATTSTVSAPDEILDALRPFAELAELFDDGKRASNMPSTGTVYAWARKGQEYELTVEHLRAAREALRTVSTAGGTASTKTGGA